MTQAREQENHQFLTWLIAIIACATAVFLLSTSALKAFSALSSDDCTTLYTYDPSGNETSRQTQCD